MVRLLMVVVLLWAGQRQGQVPAEDGVSPRFVPEAARPDAAASAARTPVAPPAAGADVAACSGVLPEQQLSCPLTGRVTAIEPVSQGVRLVVRRRGLSADQLRGQLVCQLSMAATRSELSPPCSFLAAGTNVVVRPRGKSALAVELLLTPGDEAAVGLLRERVETAFPKARRR